MNVNFFLFSLYFLNFFFLQGDRPEVVDLLLAEGANIDARVDVGEGGLTPLMISAWCSHTETVMLLLEQGANVELASEAGALFFFFNLFCLSVSLY